MGDPRAMAQAARVILLHPRQAIQRYILLLEKKGRSEEVFFKQGYYWLVQQLRPGTTVIDIGANIGDTAIYFAQFDKVARVIAYEPAPFTYRLMLQNLKDCPLRGKIEPRNEAVADRDGRMTVSNTIINSERVGMEMMKAKKGRSIRITALGKALKGLDRVVIKCDCEGGEATIFSGADLSRVYAIMVEWHGSAVKGPLIAALRERGYAVSAPKDYRCTDQFDWTGILCAKRVRSKS
jgi:FkbM family methyltransferase